MGRTLETPNRPVAIIDLGSNTVRLAVFDHLSRIPSTVFNERVFCGLGRALGASARLNEDAIPPLMACLERFFRIAAGLGAPTAEVLATAAIRDASNGGELVRQMERSFDAKVTVLTGAQEARLSALGVVYGFPDAKGVVGDLGGGSLELVEVDAGQAGRAVSLPLGALRLLTASGGDLARATAEISRQLAGVSWLSDAAGRDVYAVGGSWRAIARAHMDRTDYPVQMIHGYTLSGAEANAHAAWLYQAKTGSLERIEGIAERRVALLPIAAAVLDQLASRLSPARIVFSGSGLREGYLFDRLDPDQRQRDPLLAAAAELAAREGRDPLLGSRLAQWTDPLFAASGAAEGDPRVRHAACLLSDIGWREHPDYRADQLFARTLHYPFLGLSHRQRVTLALALYVRCAGKADKALRAPQVKLLHPADIDFAVVVGRALRLAHAISGGAAGILECASLRPEPGGLSLVLGSQALPAGPKVEKAFGDLVRAGRFAAGRIVER